MRYALIFLVVANTQHAFTQIDASDAVPLIPLENVLNPDGTINTSKGIVGSLDPTGWKMQFGPDGAPMFTAASVSADSLWDDRFNLPDVNLIGSVPALATDGTNLYLGGSFYAAGRVRTNGLARWDGVDWTGLGSGTNWHGTVYSVAAAGGNVYVGGVFDSVGGLSARNIARWNGASWSALGTGTNFGVEAIAINGSDVYAGGNSTTPGGLQGIAKWNGTTWDSLGSGLSSFGSAHAIAILGSDVYVAGYFTTAGGVPAMNIARWNGTMWDSLGSGTNNRVRCLLAAGNELYVGGEFTSAGGVSANRVAKWNGSTWSALGSGINDIVYSMRMLGSDLYVGGSFSAAGGDSARNIARWNGTNWSSVGGGLAGGFNIVSSLAVMGSSAYAFGSFTVSTSSGVAHNIARWTGTSWMPLHTPAVSLGITGAVYAIAANGNKVYVGGDFTEAGSVSANRMVMWDGSAWNPLGAGTNGVVSAIAVKGDTVYAAGSFTVAGGVNANRIARWDGSNWSPLGTGLNSAVTAMAISGNDIYVSGFFTTAGGVSANSIAKWNGSSWSALGTGVSSGIVRSLAVSGSNLYVGGLFSSIGGVSARNVARWDGNSWSPLGAGLTQWVSNIGVAGLATRGDTVYAVGDFHESGGRNGIARWNGNSWSGLGDGISTSNSVVTCVSVRGGEVFMGGSFTYPGAGIARWNGTTWSNLGSGIFGEQVNALALNEGSLYVGGSFILAGNKPANNISRWFGPPVVTFQPASGGVGSTVTISGGEFDLTPSNNIVKFGTVPAVVSSATLGGLTVTVPVGATTSPISVTTRNLTGVSATSFTVTTTTVEGSDDVPKIFGVSQNYPNPFNPATTIEFSLPVESKITVEIFNVLGQRVRELANETSPAGYHTVVWNGTEHSGNELPSGVYFCRLSATGTNGTTYSSLRKLLMLR